MAWNIVKERQLILHSPHRESCINKIEVHVQEISTFGTKRMSHEDRNPQDNDHRSNPVARAKRASPEGRM